MYLRGVKLTTSDNKINKVIIDVLIKKIIKTLHHEQHRDQNDLIRVEEKHQVKRKKGQRVKTKGEGHRYHLKFPIKFLNANLKISHFKTLVGSRYFVR